MSRKLWGIGLAFGVAILALVSVRAEEEQTGTPPSIVAGQEEQYGTARLASADGAIPAVPYRVNVSDWFESDAEMTYKYVVDFWGQSIHLNSETGELVYEPTVNNLWKEIRCYIYAVNQFGCSEEVKLTMQTEKLPDFCSVGLVELFPSDSDKTMIVGNIQQLSCQYGETIELPEYKDTKYYRFMGWWSTAENPKDEKLYTSDTPITHNVGLRPRWEQIEYQIRFWNYDKSIYQEMTKLPDEKIELPPEPERKGYRFLGWFTKPGGQGKPLADDTVVTEDTDYYAYWKKDSIGCGGGAGGLGGWGTNQPDSTEQPEKQPKKRKSSGGKRDYVSWGVKLQEQEQNNTDTDKLEVPTEDPPISAKKESIMNGYSDGTFRPEQALSGEDAEKVLKRIAAEESLLTDSEIPFENISANLTVTRGVFCVALAKALNILPDESETAAFGDLHNNTNKEYICALADMGIIRGYEDDTFRPEQFITRAETAAMINRALKRTDSQSAIASKFSDVFSTDWYYADVMNVCAYMD